MEVLNTAIEKSGINVVGKAFKDFGDEAFTVAFVLSESHFSAHYFPERNYMAIDCFTCGNEGNPIAAVAHIVNKLCTYESKIRVIERGVK